VSEHQFITNRDIVLFSFQPWDTEMGSNFKDMAVELCKRNRVLYVNRALDRASLWKNKETPQVQTRLASIREGIAEIEELQPNLWIQNPRTIVESINWIPLATFHNLLNRINNKRLAREINKAIDRLGFRDVILINDNDFIRGRYLKELVHCTDYIFYKRDYMLGVEYFQRHGPRLETALLKEVNMVAANSAYLADYAKKVNPSSFDIGQGCDTPAQVNHPQTVPPDIQRIPHPVIGYIGHISEWRIDASIISFIAEQLPHCNIVLIGSVDDVFLEHPIRNYSNVFFIGSKPAEQLPAYTAYFDVCINPQLLNDVTNGNYPRKIDEYLAAGKPVVATRTDAMKLFEPYTYLCETREEYVEKIRAVVDQPEKYNTPAEVQRRKAFALSHTWKNSIGRLGDAYFSVKSRATVPMENTESIEKNPLAGHERIRTIAILCMALYLLFIFVKFIFF
jgi:teichuronic acid biosynthesis glycosyltransferase TuaH